MFVGVNVLTRQYGVRARNAHTRLLSSSWSPSSFSVSCSRKFKFPGVLWRSGRRWRHEDDGTRHRAQPEAPGCSGSERRAASRRLMARAQEEARGVGRRAAHRNRSHGWETRPPPPSPPSSWLRGRRQEPCRRDVAPRRAGGRFRCRRSGGRVACRCHELLCAPCRDCLRVSRGIRSAHPRTRASGDSRAASVAAARATTTAPVPGPDLAPPCDPSPPGRLLPTRIPRAFRWDGCRQYSIPAYAVAYTTQATFLIALLGITYSILSASWDEDVSSPPPYFA